MISLNLFSLLIVMGTSSINAQSIVFEEIISKKIDVLIENGYSLATYDIRSLSINDWHDLDIEEEDNYEVVLIAEVPIEVEHSRLDAQTNKIVLEKPLPDNEIQMRIKTGDLFKFRLLHPNHKQEEKYKVVILTGVKNK